MWVSGLRVILRMAIRFRTYLKIKMLPAPGKARFKTRYNTSILVSRRMLDGGISEGHKSLPPTVLKSAFPEPVTRLLWAFLLNCNFEISSNKTLSYNKLG
jgi:hypothetical protein